MSVWFKSRLNPWYIWIPSNPNLYSTKIIMKMRWQTIASNVSIRTISPTATPLPKAYDCVAVYIAGRRTSLVVYGWWPQPPTKNYNDVKCGQRNLSVENGTKAMVQRGASCMNSTTAYSSHNFQVKCVLRKPCMLIWEPSSLIYVPNIHRILNDLGQKMD